MAKTRKALETSLPWHVDCRLTDELPEDNPVRRSFIINASSAAVALLLLLLGCWLLYTGQQQKAFAAYWEQRITSDDGEKDRLKALQNRLIADSRKIDRAYTLIRSPYVVHHIVQQLGRTRPERITINRIESGDASITIRGGLSEPSERASRLMGGYVESLRADPLIGPLFREITLTGLDRADGSARLSFEIVMKLKPLRP